MFDQALHAIPGCQVPAGELLRGANVAIIGHVVCQQMLAHEPSQLFVHHITVQSQGCRTAGPWSARGINIKRWGLKINFN